MNHAFSIRGNPNMFDETETIGDLLAEIGHHEEFHVASNSAGSDSSLSLEIPLY